MKIRSKARIITSSLSIDERVKATEFNNDGTLGPIIKNRSFGAYQDYKMEYPSYSSLASSFDKDLINEFYRIVISDANKKDRGIVRTPPLTIKRDPYSGKSYRYLSEDYRYNSLIISSIAKNILDSKHIPLIGGLLSSDLEYAKYTVSLNIDDKNLNEVYLRELFPLPKDDRIILTLPKNKVNHKFLFDDKDFLDAIKVNNYFNGMYVVSKYSYHNKQETIKNGIILSHKDPYFVDNVKLDAFQKKWLDKEVEKLITHSLNFKKDKQEPTDHSFFFKVLGANSNVLLKNNDNVLPLKDESIALLGLFQETPIISGDFKDIHTKNDTSLYDEIKKHTNTVSYFPLYDQYLRINTKELNDILPKLKGYDKVIVVLSDVDYYVREGIDKRSLRFKDEIYELYRKIKGYNANIITILELTGRVELREINDYSKAILLSYPSGYYMNSSIAMNLYSVIPPSGRLIESFSNNYSDYLQAINHQADHIDRYFTESIYVGYKYYDKAPENLLYPFGYGLSYSTFDIKNFNVSKAKDSVNITVTVRNTGEYDSMVPIQIYYGFNGSDSFREVKQFLDFSKVFLRRHQEKTVKFNIPLYALKVYDYNQRKLILEDGKYTFSVYLSTDKLGASKELTINTYEIVEDDLRYHALPYYNFNDESFSLPSFDVIYKKPFSVKEDDINVNMTLSDASKYLNDESIYLDYKNMIDNSNQSIQNKYIYTFYLASYPIRLLHVYIPLISKDDIKKMEERIEEHKNEVSTS